MISRIVFLLVCILGTSHGYNQCGIRGSQNRVAGGREAGKGEWPWQIQLKYFPPGSNGGSHNCGGSILNKDWILTAGHCLMHSKNTNQYKVYVGQHNVNRPGPNTQTLGVTKLIQHPKYTYGVAPYDIALVKVASPISFNSAVVSPACLSKDDKNFEGQFCFISGWGFTMKSDTDQWDEKLQTVGSTIWNTAECRQAASKVHMGTSNIRDGMHYCFGNGRVNSCQGDSGGPLSCLDADGYYKVVGLASWGHSNCRTPGAPSVYTRVGGFYDWIQDTMRRN